MTRLTLDRTALEDVGATPERLAAAIHQQLGDGEGPVPVREIAAALDIAEIRVEPLVSIEGALIAPPERSVGAILVNRTSGWRRQRYTIGHELGHFLNSWHVPCTPTGFECSRQDMIASDRKHSDRYQRQEAEANAFALAIELLAPLNRVRPFLNGAPDLERVLAMSERLDLSREAAARRFASLHDQPIAVLFSRRGRFIYAQKSRDFPWLSLSRGQPMPFLQKQTDTSARSSPEEADSDDWLSRAEGVELTVQTLHQQDGYATTLLHAVPTDVDVDEDGMEDTFCRFSKLD